jgi:hypothetical protein
MNEENHYNTDHRRHSSLNEEDHSKTDRNTDHKRHSSLRDLPNLAKSCDENLTVLHQRVSDLGLSTNACHLTLSDIPAIEHLFCALDTSNDDEVSVVEFMIGLRVVMKRLGPNFEHHSPMAIFNQMSSKQKLKVGYLNKETFVKQALFLQDPVLNKIIRAVALDADINVSPGTDIEVFENAKKKDDESDATKKTKRQRRTSLIEHVQNNVKERTIHEHIRRSIHIFNERSEEPLEGTDTINRILKLEQELKKEKMKRFQLEIELNHHANRTKSSLVKKNHLLKKKIKLLTKDLFVLGNFCKIAFGREKLLEIAKNIRTKTVVGNNQ